MRTGLRRVDWIRVVADDDGTRAYAVGAGDRLPRVVPLTMSSATQLITDGIPFVVLGMDQRPDGNGSS